MIIDRHGNIELVKGDTAHLPIDIYNEATASDYKVQEGDILTLKVRPKKPCSAAVLEKSVTSTSQIDLEPEDTEALMPGEYVYSLRLQTEGNKYTIAYDRGFKLLPEV